MTDTSPRHLILILGDQLTRKLSALTDADPARDRILMAEVANEADYTNHHRKKITLIFSAMRHFAEALREEGFRVDYHHFDPDSPLRSLCDAVQDGVTRLSPERIVMTRSGEWRLEQLVDQWQLPAPLERREDDRFIASVERFHQWAKGKKQWRMEFFYRELRRETGLLMNADGTPVGGQWNFDADNRRKWKGEPPAPAPFFVEPDRITRDVLATVEAHFPDHFGNLEGFGYAVTRQDALAALEHFLSQRLPWFGDFQDAMSDTEDTLFHSLLSPYLNCGLLIPMEVCQAAERCYYGGQAPLNAVEGFIRQILGWREFIRGIYWMLMPGYADENRLGNDRALPWFYWSGETKMRCMQQTIKATQRNAYAHHIQRLMVTGNFALLAGVRPTEICDWYLAVYADAYDWVELPNTLGMVMHADGGVLGSKPYAASGKYIQRMSDYCSHCPYNVKNTTGDDACPFNSLYWHFIDRHRDQFQGNPRMGMIYRNWDRQGAEKRQATLEHAEQLLERIETL